MTSQSRTWARLALACIITSIGLVTTSGVAGADPSLAITTPYPAIEVQPGSTVKLDFNIASDRPEPVDLSVGGLAEGWTATLRGGGFVIHQITSEPGDDTSTGAAATLEIDVPADASAGDHRLTVTALDAEGARSVVAITLTVADQVDNGITLAADFPSLSGEPGGTLTYTLTVENETPIEQTFTFDPTGPQGWTVTASPTAEAKAQTLTVDAGDSSTLKVSATSPATAEEGTYPIDVAVIGANGASGTFGLEAQVVGTPQLALGTADDRLNVTGSAGSDKRIPLIIANTGTAPMESVKLAGTAPSDWDVSFDPKEIAVVKPGETTQVTAIVSPSSDAVAGDYAMTVRASAGSLSSDVDLRYTVEGSRTLGFAAIAVIAAAFAGLAGVFVKFGRR
jgi:uncharacterized membrane protein